MKKHIIMRSTGAETMRTMPTEMKVNRFQHLVLLHRIILSHLLLLLNYQNILEMTPKKRRRDMNGMEEGPRDLRKEIITIRLLVKRYIQI